MSSVFVENNEFYSDSKMLLNFIKSFEELILCFFDAVSTQYSSIFFFGDKNSGILLFCTICGSNYIKLYKIMTIIARKEKERKEYFLKGKIF